MKIKIELTEDEVDQAIRNYIRQWHKVSIPPEGDVRQTFLGREIVAGAIYEVVVE